MATRIRTTDMNQEEFVASVLAKLERDEQDYPARLRRIRRRIADFEQIHGMTTEELKRGLASGEIQETHDHVIWLMESHALEGISNS